MYTYRVYFTLYLDLSTLIRYSQSRITIKQPCKNKRSLQGINKKIDKEELIDHSEILIINKTGEEKS